MKNKLFILIILVLFLVAIYFIALIPSVVIEQYKKISALGPFWGYLYLTGLGLGALLFLAAAGWFAYTLWKESQKEKKRAIRDAKEIAKMSPSEKEKAITSYIQEAKELVSQSDQSDELKKAIEKASANIEAKQKEEELEIAAFGTISSGKSSVLNQLLGKDIFKSDVIGGTTQQVSSVEWPGIGKVILVDTPGLAEIEGGKRGFDARKAAKNADLVLFVLDGPLKDFEFRTIQNLYAMGKRIIVCLNKRDWYSDSDLDLLLNKIRTQLESLVLPEDVIAIQAEPVKRKRTIIKADGSVVEEEVEIKADIEPLALRLLNIIKEERKELLLNNLLLQARGLKTDILEQLKVIRDEKAKQTINDYTWKAAAAAAVSPTPFVDVAVGLGFSFKMIMDLANIYGKKMDIQSAKELVSQLMKNLCANLGATSLSPALSQLVASSLKGVPGMGTIAGGALQGMVQALVTQWIGRVMKDYFSKDKQGSVTALDDLARKHWERLTSKSELINLTMSGIQHIKQAQSKDKSSE